MRFRPLNDHVVVQLIAFVAAYTGVISQSTGDLHDVRIHAGATAAACAAVLALKKRPGS